MNDTISCAINCNYLFQEKKNVLKLERKKLNYNNSNHTRERMKTNQKKT